MTTLSIPPAEATTLRTSPAEATTLKTPPAETRGMLFDQRTRAALRDAGLTRAAIDEVEQTVTDQAQADARRVESFFDGLDVVYSDMDRTHSTADYPEHDFDYVDLFTHSEDIRGFVRFDTWGAYVEGARVLEREATDADGASGQPLVVELALGPTVHDRVRFAADRSLLE